jgi:hypothetical protein
MIERTAYLLQNQVNIEPSLDGRTGRRGGD